MLPKPDLTELEVLAIKSLLEFRATSDEQRHAVTAILAKVCRRGDSPYVADGPDRDVFTMIGRHQVGVMITSAADPITLAIAIQADKDRANPPPPKPERPIRKNRRTEK
jgi:hypothetical protein